MTEKYDGWTIQNCCGKNPWLVFGFAESTRKEAIANFELIWGKGYWRKERRKGNFKLVKVKLVVVE